MLTITFIEGQRWEGPRLVPLGDLKLGPFLGVHQTQHTPGVIKLWGIDVWTNEEVILAQLADEHLLWEILFLKSTPGLFYGSFEIKEVTDQESENG